jgi:hypothetical protein
VDDRARTGDRLDHKKAAPDRAKIKSRMGSGFAPAADSAAKTRYAGIFGDCRGVQAEMQISA